jgi:hypothetical protein
MGLDKKLSQLMDIITTYKPTKNWRGKQVLQKGQKFLLY